MECNVDGFPDRKKSTHKGKEAWYGTRMAHSSLQTRSSSGQGQPELDMEGLVSGVRQS